MMTNGDCEGRIFSPTLTQIMESFSYSPLITHFIWKKYMKKRPENVEYAKMRHGEVILTLQ